MRSIEPLTIQDVVAARARIASSIARTPLIRLAVDAPAEIYLKLESLQPIGSFKIRGAMNAIRSLPPESLSGGVYTASAGNMAQGVAWGARELGVPCTVVMPDNAPRTKLEAVARLGASIVPASMAREMVLGPQGTLFVGSQRAGKVHAVIDRDGPEAHLAAGGKSLLGEIGKGSGYDQS